MRTGSWPDRRRVALAVALVAVCRLAYPAGEFPVVRIDDDLLARFEARYGGSAAQRLLEWKRILGQSPPRIEGGQRVEVNEFFNRIPWLSDQEHWGRRDYWATPLEVIGTNGADCEDFSIGKYFSLVALRVPGDRLLITYVRATTLDQAHMVLAYYPTPSADPWILDNLVGEIRRGSERADLVPVYSFNADGLWQSVERGLGQRVGVAERLAPWRKLLERMRAELAADRR